MAAIVFITSIPKSGTHLLIDTFERMGFQTDKARKGAGMAVYENAVGAAEDTAIFAHARATDPVLNEWVKETHVKPLVLIRDPRDVALSLADFLARGRPGVIGRADPEFCARPKIELFEAVVAGYRNTKFTLPSIRSRMQGWKEWSAYGAVTVSYESLASIAAGKKSAAFCTKIGVDAASFKTALTGSFGTPGSSTFNTARTQRWRTDFTRNHLEIWNAHAKGVAQSLGYREIPTRFKVNI